MKTGANDVAVIVAVEDYVFLPDVAGATTNGNDWENYFKNSLGVGSVYFLSNENGTKEEIERFALLASQQSKPGGTVWFVFIGHGAPAKSGNEGLLVGADARQDPNSLFARGLPQQTLLDILQTGQQTQTVLIVDACFSGRATDGSALAPAQPVIPTTLNPTLTANTVVLSAAESDEFAGSLPNKDRPAFSYLLLGALHGWAADSNKVVTAGNAKSFVERSLRGIPGRMTQTPAIHGQSNLVLARGVTQGDPGIAALMREEAKKGGPTSIVETNTVIKSTAAATGIPVLPDKLNPNGAINLSVDAEVLVARDQAIQAEANGVSNPSAAKEAWEAVAKLKGQNPFKEEAMTRANQWAEYAKKQRDLAAQKTADTNRLQKILPLASVSESNKLELIKNYASLYGGEDVVSLIGLVEPAEARHRLCEPYMKAGRSELFIDMPRDRDGESFLGKVQVAGTDVGTAPTTVKLPQCAKGMEVKVTEVESGKVWTSTVKSLSPSSTTSMDAYFEDIVPYSFWHDYMMVDDESGPLLGVMYSQLGFPSDFNRSNANLVRGNVELGIGSFASHFSIWFEPIMVMPQDGQDLSWAFAGGGSIGRIPWGRFSFTPLRAGYVSFTGADLSDLSGFTGQAVLRFHLGKGFQLRGDGGVMRGTSKVNGEDWSGYVWNAGGGVEYGNDFIHEATDSLLDDTSIDGEDWTEWSYGSISAGYSISTGFLSDDHTAIGMIQAEAKGADDSDGMRLALYGAPEAIGLGTSSFGGVLAWAMMNDDEDFVMTYGFVGEYLSHTNEQEKDDSYSMLGMLIGFGWHLGAHVSLNGDFQLNFLSLLDFSDEDDTTAPEDETEGRNSNMHPFRAYLRYVTPFGVYMQGGVRGDIVFDEDASGWGELGYLSTFD